MAFTYSKLAEVTVGSGGASSIDFANIPQNYTDLVLKISGRGSASALTSVVSILLNGSSTNFTNKYVAGSGASASTGAVVQFVGDFPAATSTASTFSNTEIYIPNYTSSANKSFSVDHIHETNGTTAYAELSAELWSNVTFITNITLSIASGTFVQYSTATLYGVKAEV